MRKVLGVVFSDKDFHKTFEVLLMTYVEFREDWHMLHKESICNDLNALSGAMYNVFQNKFSYGGELERELTAEYLTITEDQILMNGDLTQYIMNEHTFSNGEVFYVEENRSNSGFYEFASW